jgi:hypothetical protein
MQRIEKYESLIQVMKLQLIMLCSGKKQLILLTNTKILTKEMFKIRIIMYMFLQIELSIYYIIKVLGDMKNYQEIMKMIRQIYTH